MELEPNHPMDDFELELRQALERRPAPPGLKRRLMEGRRRPRAQRSFSAWQRMAASFALVAVLAGSAEWHTVQERRKEQEAREQVLTALRITSRALDQMNARLAAHRRGAQD